MCEMDKKKRKINLINKGFTPTFILLIFTKSKSLILKESKKMRKWLWAFLPHPFFFKSV